MGKRATGKAASAAKKAEPATHLYLCWFTFDEPAEPPYEGSFLIVVEAKDPEGAVKACRIKLRSLHRDTKLFEQPVTIYIEGLIRLSGSFKKGLLVNMDCGPCSDTRGRITCLIPDEQEHEAEGYGVGQEPPEGEGQIVEPFIDFEGKAACKAIKAAKSQPATITPTQARTKASAEALAIASKEDATVSRAARERERARRHAEQERKKALAVTLAELDGRGTRGERNAATKR